MDLEDLEEVVLAPVRAPEVENLMGNESAGSVVEGSKRPLSQRKRALDEELDILAPSFPIV